MWRRCSICKSEIGFEQPYWVCNVSTCNRKRTGLVFCSVSCWDAHLGFENHRESWAVERRAPARGGGEPAKSPPPPTPRRRRTVPPPAPERAPASDPVPRDILIVASKLKQYVRAASGLSTSDRVMSVLSDRVRALCDEAIRSARRAERKTVLERDFER
jgi:hypothetical protein